MPADDGPAFRYVIAGEVRAQLARRRMSGRELSRRVGAKPAWMDRRLTGKTPMDVDDLEVIARALDMTPLELVASATAYGARTATTQRDAAAPESITTGDLAAGSSLRGINRH